MIPCQDRSRYGRRVRDATEEALTIDALARETGMTARNIRAHQSRGLLPPPALRGRTGIYGPEHVARVRAIQELQGQGFNLEAIRRVLERVPAGADAALVDFVGAVSAPFTDETPEIVPAAEMAARWGDELTPDVVKRVRALDLSRPVADGAAWEVRSPRLERAARELAGLGVPLSDALDVLAALRAHAQAVAEAYAELFLEQVWRPFAAAGEPAEDLPRVREALDRLRPLAAESLLAVFGLVMTETVERALAREMDLER